MKLSDWVEDFIGYHKRFIYSFEDTFHLPKIACNIDPIFVNSFSSKFVIKFSASLLEHDYLNLNNTVYNSAKEAMEAADIFLNKYEKLYVFM